MQLKWKGQGSWYHHVGKDLHSILIMISKACILLSSAIAETIFLDRHGFVSASGSSHCFLIQVQEDAIWVDTNIFWKQEMTQDHPGLQSCQKQIIGREAALWQSIWWCKKWCKQSCEADWKWNIHSSDVRGCWYGASTQQKWRLLMVLSLKWFFLYSKK